MFEYKGYKGRVEFDDEARIFAGVVVNSSDVITFQGESVAELQKAFIDSVDDYLEFCALRSVVAKTRICDLAKLDTKAITTAATA